MPAPSSNAHQSLAEALRGAIEHHQAGRLALAERGYRQALAIMPSHAESLHLLGILMHQAGCSDLAIAHIERAIALQPDAAHFHNNLGNILRDIGRPADACRWYERALAFAPDLPDLHHNRAKALVALGRLEEAELAFRQALALRPDFFDPLLDLGNLLCDAGRDLESAACLDAALRLHPGHPAALNNLGRALIKLGRPEEAERHFREAIAVQPDYANAHLNLGALLGDARRFDEAADCLRSAVRFAPDDALACFYLGMLQLITGRVDESWRTQWSGSSPRVWHGDPVGDATVIVYADQGLGDAILFARYLPLCAARARIMFAGPPALNRLISRLDGVTGFLDGRPPFPEHTRYCPLTLLYRIFGAGLGTVPARVPYLSAVPEDAERWRQRTASLAGLRVGLVWAGNPRYSSDRDRSLPFQQLAAALDLSGVALVSLQKGPAAGQIATTLYSAPAVHDWMDEVADLADTAALIETLDLVVGVDTAVVNLAGALGKPVWMLNRFASDWRWHLDREDSVWYPTMRIFRQERAGDWDAPLARLRAALTELVRQRDRSAMARPPA